MATFLSHYNHKQPGGKVFYTGITPTGSLKINPRGSASSKMNMLEVFASVESDKEEIYPVTMSKISSKQCVDSDLKYFFKDKQDLSKNYLLNTRFSLKVIDDVEILTCERKKLVIPMSLQSKVITWYHYYLMHPGHTRLEETLTITMYSRTLR